MVYSGRIYETDGANPVAVHEPDEVRPLAPIPQPPSLRLFRTDLQPEPVVGLDLEDPRYFYASTSCLIGASTLINDPEISSDLGFEPYLAAILVGGGYKVDVPDADDLILGFTIVNFLVARDVDRVEIKSGAGFGRSHDMAATIGPVITTPDELDDNVIDQQRGRQYLLTVIARVNGVERGRGQISELPFTFAQAISSASQSCTLRSGDVIALGPIVADERGGLEPGDEVQIAVEQLGQLALKLSPNQ